jgi:CHAT domain-containing protein
LLLVGDVDYQADPEGNRGPAQNRNERNGPNQTSLLAGSATRAADDNVQFARLEGTAEEMVTIKKLYRATFDVSDDAINELQGEAATEEAFRQFAPRCRNLHIATHGFFADPKYQSVQQSNQIGDANMSLLLSTGADQRAIRSFHPGVLSGLALAGASHQPMAGKDDGILTAAEVEVQPLHGAELVVLSACETALGPVAGGEGLLGLQRAFQLSGARTTVATLWKVDDSATRRLMARFYGNLWEKKMSKLDALREAQLWMLNHPEAVAGHERGQVVDFPNTRVKDIPSAVAARTSPRFWAGFVLSGDWR